MPWWWCVSLTDDDARARPFIDSSTTREEDCLALRPIRSRLEHSINLAGGLYHSITQSSHRSFPRFRDCITVCACACRQLARASTAQTTNGLLVSSSSSRGGK
jgi:hypothetical protein